MSFQESVSLHFTELTKNDKKIVEQLLENPNLLINQPIQKAAVSLDVSPAAIMRVVKKIGYRGLPELKAELEAYSCEGSKKKTKQSNQSFTHNILEVFKNNLDFISESINDQQFESILRLMKNAHSIRAIGIGSSGLSAEQFAYSFFYQDKYIEAVTDQTKIYYLARALEKEDLLFLYSVSGNLNLYKDLFQKKKKAGAKLILITMSHDEKLKKYCDEMIVLPSILTEAMNNRKLTQLDNRFSFLVFTELLANYIQQHS